MIPRNGAGRVDWKWYAQMLIPMAITLLIAAAPLAVWFGVLQERMENDAQKRTRIAQMLQPIVTRLTRLEAQADAINLRMNDHVTTPGHSVMVERVDRLQRDIKDVRSDMTALGNEFTKDFLRKSEHREIHSK